MLFVFLLSIMTEVRQNHIPLIAKDAEHFKKPFVSHWYFFF